MCPSPANGNKGVFGEIDAEYRFVVANQKVVVGSQYKLNEVVDISPYYPIECVEYAERVAAYWSPHAVYIMDIAMHQGRPWVIEIGPFNYAGLYLCNLEKVVEAIESL